MPPSVATAFHAVESARNARILELIAHAVTPLLAKNTAFRGSHYAIQDGKVSIEPANRGDEPFAAGGACLFREWIEPEQLFGCVRIHNGDITLQPGLVHRANGGVLILSAWRCWLSRCYGCG